MKQERDIVSRPTHVDELSDSRFLKAGLFKGEPVTLRIAEVVIERLEGENGIEKKATMSFTGTDKCLVLNRTNAICLAAMFGKNVPDWFGKRVTLFPTTTKQKGKEVDCIRVWGSPDIDRQFDVTIELARKKPFRMTMHKVTRAASAPATDPPPQPEAEAQPDPPPPPPQE